LSADMPRKKKRNKESTGTSGTPGISTKEHREILEQIDNQDTGWRWERDKDEDYIHFRQRNSEAIAMLERRGIKIHPIDNQIGKAVRDSVSTLVENKKDARLLANPNVPPELASAISEKLAVAEDESFCDRQCFGIATKQAGVGIGWLEVYRNSNLLESPYRISEAPRNELFRDETVPISEWYDGQWMYQRKYIHWKVASAMWPGKSKQIKDLFKSEGTFDWQPPEGGYSTGLQSSTDDREFWTQEERRWFDSDKGLINIGVAYVKSVNSGLVLVSPQYGSLIFDKDNKYHIRIASEDRAKIVRAPVTTMTRNWFAGPLKLGSEVVKSGKFPYVPFYYFIDGRTGHPYGISRFLMSLQDEHNARTANDLWNLGSMRVKMTNGAVDMPIDEYAAMVSRPDAVVPLNLEHMNAGGIYEEKREYELSEEQYKRNVDLRQAMREAAGTDDAKQGHQGTPENFDYIAPGKSLSLLISNFEFSRMAVIDRLLDFVLEDSLDAEEVVIPAKMMSEEQVVLLNHPMDDGTIMNDVMMFRGKVRLDDIPSSPERTRQELISLSEVAKSVKHEGIQNQMAPWLVQLSGIPFKEELARELRAAVEMPDEQQTQERIKEAVEKALVKAQTDLKARELDIKELSATSKAEKESAEISLIEAKKVLEKVEAVYSSMQSAMAIFQNAGIVPIGQQVLNSSGFEDEDEAPVVAGGQGVTAASPTDISIEDVSRPVQQVGPGNTSPIFPPRTQGTSSPVRASSQPLETLEEADRGAAAGIEKQGNQVGE
jgi:hypothetical protein